MAQYTPSPNFEIDAGAYTPAADFDFRTQTELSALLSAALLPAPQALGLDALIVQARTAQAGLDAALNAALQTLGLDASIVRSWALATGADSLLLKSVAVQTGFDAALNAAPLQSALEAAILKEWVLTAGLEASFIHARQVQALLQAALNAATVRTGLDAGVVVNRTLQASLNTALAVGRLVAAGLDAHFVGTIYKSALLDVVVGGSRHAQAMVDAALANLRKLATFPDAWLLGRATVERVIRARLDVNLLPGDDMALSFSTGLRNHLLGNYARMTGDGLGGAMHNCFLDIYQGDKPASPDYPPVHGTYLGTFQLSENPYANEWGGSWSAPARGSIRKEDWQTWQMLAAKTGAPGWFRMRLIDDLNDYSTTAHRIDGTVGPVYGEYDLVMKVAEVVQDQVYTLSGFAMWMREDN